MENPLLFQVLNEMDGLADDADVAFLLTTNRADLLEPALSQRPGRVDLAVEIPLPDAAGRRRLIGALGEPDSYCPIMRGEQRRLVIRQAAAREMPKLESACTTIVIARD